MATCGDELENETEPEESVKFNLYEKMSTSTNGWVSRKLDAIKQWVALEKVHGANLSFTAQRKGAAVSVRIARRTAYLAEGENFFSIYQQKGFVEGETQKVRQLFEEVCKSVEGPVLAVTVYGELFGGSYPHPSVPPVPKLRPVQREVLYCPDLRFMAFDIAVIQSTSATTNDQRRYLDYDVCMRLFKSCGLFYAQPLATGSLQAMLNYPLGWDSKIPAMLGLPPLPEGVKNAAEGVVVKPIKDMVLETEAGNEPMRVIFKRKIEAFRERKPRERIQQPEGNDTEYNQDYELVKCELFAMVTQQRLVNVISKEGLPDATEADSQEVKAKWNCILNALVSDILEDTAIEHDELWKSFKREHSALVGKLKSELRRECGLAIKEHREHNP